MKKFFSSLMAGFMALCLTGMILSCSNSANNGSSTPETRPTTYTVTFNANDDSTKPVTESQTFTEGEAQTLKKIIELGFARSGYNFAGWGIKADDTQASFSDGASYTATKDITLYALWTQIPMYHVNVEANGNGVGRAVPDTAPAGTEITLYFEAVNGYKMTDLSVVGSDGKEITVKNGKFIMPACDVDASANFFEYGYFYSNLSNLEDIISQLEDDATIVMTGEVKSSDLETIKNLINNSEHEIKLDLSSVTGLTKISDSAFGVCSKLSAISIPDTVREIEQFAFISCYGLKTIEIPEGVVTIGHDAFQMSGITSVKIPSSVKSIGKQAFMGCDNLKSIELSYKVTVEPDAFGFCGLESVKISGNDITIEDNAFEFCSNLKSIEISGSGTYIGKYGFSNGRKIESVDITGKNTVIGDYAFGGCSFESITISGSGTTIGNYVFAHCFELKSVEISTGVIAIGKGLFSLCFSLESIKFNDANGWYYTDNEDDWKNRTNGIALPDLTDASKNVEYFVDGDYSYYLYKLSSNN